MWRRIVCVANILPLARFRYIHIANLYTMLFLCIASCKCFMLETVSLSVVLGTHPVPSHRHKSACQDFSALWPHHSCKLSLCNGEAVVLAPRWGSVFLLHPQCPFLLLFHIFALSPSPIRPTCDCEQGRDAFKAGRGRVFSITFKCCWQFFLPVKPPLMNITNTTYKMWFWFCICLPLYASSV